ncbi:MAG: hypothetical protein ACPLKX_08895 [Dictyoglomaceae bacterium]
MIGNLILSQDMKEKQDIKNLDFNWEEEYYQKGCTLAREEAIKRLDSYSKSSREFSRFSNSSSF